MHDGCAMTFAHSLVLGWLTCNSRCMARPDAMPGSVPEWDVADRMRKSLRHADIGVQEIADYLGVSRNTVSTWINGRIQPGRQTLRLWALRCGVDFEWLAGELGARRRVPAVTQAHDVDALDLTPRVTLRLVKAS